MDCHMIQVRWTQHDRGVMDYLTQLLHSELHVDVTLCCQNRRFRAHRVLLSASSSYLRKILTEHAGSEEVTIILPDIHHEDLHWLLVFMYTGAVAVPKSRVTSFLQAAESLHVKVITDICMHDAQSTRNRPENSFSHLFVANSQNKNTPSPFDLCDSNCFPKYELPQSNPHHNEQMNVERPCRSFQQAVNSQTFLALAQRPKAMPSLKPINNCNGEVPETFLDKGFRINDIASHLRDNCGIEALNLATTSQDNRAFRKTCHRVPRLSPIVPPSPWAQNQPVSCPTKFQVGARFTNPPLHHTIYIDQSKTSPPIRVTETKATNAQYEEAAALQTRDPVNAFHKHQTDNEKVAGDLPAVGVTNPLQDAVAIKSEQNGEGEFAQEGNDIQVLTDANTKSDNDNNNNGKSHGCEDCGKSFSRRQLLVQHRRIHTGERPFTCAECGRQFTQRGHWSTHQKLHQPARRPEHACTSCGKAFVTRASLKVHLRTHTGEKPFQCGECGKQFSQLRNYKYHRSVHEGTREFAATCPECGKYFNDRGYLSSHMKIHRNRKEYGCQFCSKSFNQRVAYNMHVRIHTGERPHSCPHCNKSFSRKMLLKQHLRIHTGEKPFSCSVCGKAFADRSNMTLHMRLHSGIKPYSCQLCSKAFTKKHHLKTHLNYHTGTKPYSCSKCGLRFSQSSNMRTHFKKCTSAGVVITPPHSDESSCGSSKTGQANM